MIPWKQPAAGPQETHTISQGHPLKLAARSDYNPPSEAHGGEYARPKYDEHRAHCGLDAVLPVVDCTGSRCCRCRHTGSCGEAAPDGPFALRRAANSIVKILAEGYTPSLPAPRIVLGRTESFGNYDDQSNEVHMSTWTSLSSDDRKMFERIAKAHGGAETPEQAFENGTYRWVFVHELSHWWQRSRHQVRPNSWVEENGANHIAMAFWNEQDPRFMAGITSGFKHLREAIPDPVPTGQSKRAYLDTHFVEIGPTPAYTWYQADMIVELSTESPSPTFHRALSQPLYPD